MATFNISGRIVSKESQLPVPGVRVEAWNWDIRRPVLLGEANTDATGNYAISLDDAYFRDHPIDALPEVIFKILRGDRLLDSYSKKVLWSPRTRSITLDLEVSLTEQPEEPIPNLVQGRVNTSQGEPLEKLLVQAWDRNLQEELLLGEENTDETGSYTIAYIPKEMLPQGKTQADLLVKVLDTNAEVLATSSLYCKAPSRQEVNFQLETETYRGPSEFERILRSLTPYLDGTEMAELTPEQVEYLVCKSGGEQEKITALARAYQNMREADVPPEAFYALSRKELPMELPELLAQPLANLREALEQATEANIIPFSFHDRLDETMVRLKELAVDHLLRAPEIKTDYSLSGLFNISLPRTEQQKTLLGLWLSREGTTEDFWKNLGEHPEFTEVGLVEEIQFTLKLNLLTQSHLPLIKWLRQADNLTKYQTMGDLVTLEKADWEKILEDKVGGTTVGYPPHIAGTDEAEKKSNYATALFSLVENVFPMARLTHKVSQDSFPEKDDLLTFLNINPDFEFDKVYLERYLKQDGRLASVQDKPALITRLKSMQRLYKLTPRYEEMQHFMHAGIDSARAIVKKGKANLNEAFAEVISKEKMAEIVANAENVVSATLLMYMKWKDYGPGDPSKTPASYGPVFPSPELPESISEDVSNWTEMFGSFNLCECEHCRSVYSPAAYMVDLLEFLEKQNISAKNLLLSRRPDLAEIELSCANTNAVLPYVDLVNEVLENAIAPQYFTFAEIDGFDKALNSNDFTKIPIEVLKHFSDNGFPLSEKLAIEADVLNKKILPIKNWYISDGAWLYSVRRNLLSNIYTIYPSPQTSGKQEDLGVQPEHLNKNAYELLKESIFPFSLPFDLWHAEIKYYLEYLGLTKFEVSEAFSNADEVNLLQNVALALEYLDLTETEKSILGNSADGWNLWGLQEQNNKLVNPLLQSKPVNGTWIEVLSVVPVFLHRSGLNYQQLKELVVLPWIQSGKFLKIISEDKNDQDTCDLVKMKLEGLTADVLVRIAKFIRLWRKLGWPIYELGKALMVIKSTGATPATEVDPTPTNKEFLFLYHVQRLHTELKVPVIEILSWWSNIDYIKFPGGPNTHFEKLFLNKSVENPDEPGFKDLSLGKNIQGTFSTAATSIMAAYSIDEPALQLIRTAYSITDELTIENLSGIFRVVSFARALNVSIVDCIAMEELTGLNPFDLSNTHATLQFMQIVKGIKAAGFKMEALDYVLRNHFPETFESTPEEVSRFHWEIRQGLLKINTENQETIQPNLDVLSRNLQLLFPEKVVADVLKLLDMPATLKDDTDTKTEREKLIKDYLTFLDVNEATTQLLVAYDENKKPLQLAGEKVMRMEYLLQGLLPHVKKVLGSNFISEKLASHLKLGLDVTKYLLEEVLTSRVDNQKPIIEDWIDLAKVGLQAEYFEVATFTNAKLKRNDEIIDFNWGDKGPDSLISDPSTYSVRWEGNLVPNVDGDYTFYLEGTGKATLWVNGVELISKPASLNEQASAVPLELKTGQFYKIKIEYSISSDLGHIKWLWSSGTLPKTVVPANQLFPLDYVKLKEGHRLLQKAGLILSAFGITTEELRFLMGKKVLDLNKLPLTKISIPKDVTWKDWQTLMEWMRLKKVWKLQDFTWPEALKQLSLLTSMVTHFNELLLKQTDWDERDYDYLTNTLWKLSPANMVQEPGMLLRLIHAMEATNQIGLSAQNINEWLIPQIDALKAMNFKKALNAKYDNQAWLGVARPIKDKLRKQQLAAMVAYLTCQSPTVKNAANAFDTNDLYRYYLIDVEMDPCMTTSRIKQAISTIQLFVQRAMMGLEKGIVLSEDARHEWKWRKNYRVWEANRKVFLYPENWIEPELRDYKTPFFKELETELLQNEITDETVEDAFVNYLYKLDEVAQLNLVGMYHDLDTETIHVFGRTHMEPYIYYYRRREETTWTPWEKMDLDIEGDHLIPVVWNYRLYLFWAIFNKMQGEEWGGENTEDWEIKLAWSEYENNTWSPKKLSNETIISGSDNKENPRNFRANDEYDIITPSKNSKAESDVYYRQDIEYWKYLPKPSEHLMLLEMEPNNSIRISIVKRYPKKIVKGFVLSQRYIDAQNPYTGFSTSSKNGESFILEDIEKSIEDNRTIGKFIFENCKNNVYSEENESNEKPNKIFGPIDSDNYFMEMRSGDKPLQFNSTSVLTEKPSKFEYLPHDLFVFPNVFFYQDQTKTFFVEFKEEVTTYKTWVSEIIKLPDGTVITNVKEIEQELKLKKFFFDTFYHPYVCEFIKRLNQDGISGLLNRKVQGILPQEAKGAIIDYTDKSKKVLELLFVYHYKPVNENVATPYPIEDVDFKSDSAYSNYNWELFFHIPLLIADRLSKNQRYDEALKWFHFIFDPKADFTGLEKTFPIAKTNPEARYWKLLPFFNNMEAKESLLEIMGLLHVDDPGSPSKDDPLLKKKKQELVELIDQWQDNPFNPHLIARSRLAAYQKTVVMKYLDTLIAWGDQLFSRDTIESLNEATQYYILAAEILDTKPQKVSRPVALPIKTYSQLDSISNDPLSNPLVNLENIVAKTTKVPTDSEKKSILLSMGNSLYFCIPKNEKLLEYWETIADRLFKIRHCMNIEGVTRQLPLFEPPIDPALLVKAAAAGIDISSALNDLYAPLPHYRFSYMLQKSLELCQDVKSLGATLLSVLEKKDAEELALVWAGQETSLLKAIKEIKKQQIKEAKTTLDGIHKSKAITEERFNYYANIEKVSDGEVEQLARLKVAQMLQKFAQLAQISSSLAFGFPNFESGSSGNGGHGVTVYGGTHIGHHLQAIGGGFSYLSNNFTYDANMASIKAGYDRRWDDWKLQEKLASKELQQIDKQIAAAEIRQSMAENELANHEKQIENASSVESYMKSKYTNRELYSWMQGQVSGIFFQTYQLAYDLAKKAERAYRFELGMDKSDFIQFGYWDNLKKGLLSGEKLYHALKRLESAYLDQNRRRYELTRHISLIMLKPLALLEFREKGKCEFDIPELLFDMDFPGQYMRRIRSVTVSIPCITGPYTNVNAKLTLLKSRVRKTANAQGEYKYAGLEDPNFTQNPIGIQSIATSSGQNDSGMFEFNFRDERLLPFEGAGAISSWRMELPGDFRQFNYDTIADVIIHFNYTAFEGGDALRQLANENVTNTINKWLDELAKDGAGLQRMFSLRHEFSNEWHQLIHSEDNKALLKIEEQHFPYFIRGRKLESTKVKNILSEKNVTIYLKTSKVETEMAFKLDDQKDFEDSDFNKFIVHPDKNIKNLFELDFKHNKTEDPRNSWRIQIKKANSFQPEDVEDILIVFHYTIVN